MFGSLDGKKSLLLSAAMAGLVTLLLTANHLGAEPGTKVNLIEHLQDKRLPAASSPSSTQSAAKVTSGLVITPFSRISHASAVAADRSARAAEVAYNVEDNEYLVVWQSDGLTEVKGVTDIYGQRINGATGQVIGINFRISNLSDGGRDRSASDPEIVYNSTSHEYLVVWHGSGLLDTPDEISEIYGQRLSRSGKEIGGDFRISNGTDLGRISNNFVRVSAQADVAWNSVNNQYLVIWKGMGERENLVKMEIYGQLLNAKGEALGDDFRISETTNQGSNFQTNAPAIAYNTKNNQYLVVWSGGSKKESQTEVWGRALNDRGRRLSPAQGDFLISQISTNIGANRRASSAHVAYNSDTNEYFVVFQSNALPGESNVDVNEIFGQRIDAAKLTEVGANDFRISNSAGAHNRASRPSVTYNTLEKQYLVIWRSVRANAPFEICGQRISSNGTEIAADVQISNIGAIGKDRSVNNGSLAHNSTNGHYLVVWQGNALPGDSNSKINEVFGQHVKPQKH